MQARDHLHGRFSMRCRSWILLSCATGVCGVLVRCLPEEAGLALAHGPFFDHFFPGWQHSVTARDSQVKGANSGQSARWWEGIVSELRFDC